MFSMYLALSLAPSIKCNIINHLVPTFVLIRTVGVVVAYVIVIYPFT